MYKYFIVAILIGIASYFYYDKYAKEEQRLENVLTGLLLEEKNVNMSKDLPIAVGFGSCLDLLVDGIPLMNSLGIKAPAFPKYHENLQTVEQIAETFAYFLSQGAAAERYIPLATLKQLVKSAEKINNARWAPGGNAPVISNRFTKEGFKNVHVGAQVSQKFKSFYKSSKLQFSNDVEGGNDDIHLIMEYKVGEKWGPYTVPRANRFVVHSDQNNPFISSLETFDSILKQINPRLVVVGGLQMLDNFPFKNGDRENRMAALANVLKSLPKSTLIHFEMASFSELEMMNSLLTNVIPYVDSFGMNEQELPNMFSIIKYGNITEIADANPRTAVILDQIREIYKYSLVNSKRGLSRIHVHTLAFQAILTKRSAQWKNIRAGSARASLTANRHVCGNENINVKNTRLIMDDSFAVSSKIDSPRIKFNENKPISCWIEDDYEVCVAPVLVCTKVKQTIGGGDNITPAGLMPQI